MGGNGQQDRHEHPYQRELDVATSAIRVAAKISQNIIKHKKKGVIHKDDLTPVTIADFAIQALLCATVKTHFPHDHVVGEENASQLRSDLLLLEHVYDQLLWVAGHGEGPEAEAARKAFPEDCRVPTSREHMCDLIDECGLSSPVTEGRTWIFDPIDGTKTYVQGEQYAINVALLVDGQQAMGAVGCPNMSMKPAVPFKDCHVDETGTIAFAIKGHGAFVQPMDGTSAPVKLIPLAQSLSLHDIRFVTCTTVDSALAGVNEDVARRINPDGMPDYPACDLLPWVLRWVSLARGLGNTTTWVYKGRDRVGKVWDHAGAMLLFEETGGRITDVFGRPINLVTGRKMLDNFGFVAAPAQLHGEVLEVVQSVLRDNGHGVLLENGP